MRLRRLGLVAAAVTFARSERGQKMIRQARERYDTPENRAKVREAVAGARSGNKRART